MEFTGSSVSSMGVGQGVAMESLKYRYGQPCPTPLRPVSGPPLKRSQGNGINDMKESTYTIAKNKMKKNNIRKYLRNI
jgi:hypothetical protein